MKCSGDGVAGSYQQACEESTKDPAASGRPRAAVPGPSNVSICHGKCFLS